MKINFSSAYNISENISKNFQNKNFSNLESDFVVVIGNERVRNLFNKKILTCENFEKEYHQYLDYGIVILIGKKITIYNDIYGAYPLYYAFNEKKILEIQNTFVFDTQKDIDELAIVEFLHFNHLLRERTLNKSVKRISAGHKVEITDQDITSKQIFCWDDLISKISVEQKETPSFYLEQYIQESLNKEDITLTLTGGFDSRLLLSVMLSKIQKFKTITWGLPGNLQTSTASNLSTQFGLDHEDIELKAFFLKDIGRYLDYMAKNATELPFITDIPQFLYMCENLKENENLVSGFMGSEIIRGPSYSSQVTLTKFAADIGLCNSRAEIKSCIYKFQESYPYINQSFLDCNIEKIVDNYQVYSKIDAPKNLPNSNIFQYLFYEKYAKIYGLIINYHQLFNINLINPYMDFKFISSVFSKNKALTKMTPYQNSTFKNFLLYRLYAQEIKNTYPAILNTKLDRGYFVKDLINIKGILKLIPYQIYRRQNKKSGNIKKVVDSYSWYESHIEDEFKNFPLIIEGIIEGKIVKQKIKDSKNLDNLDKIKLQLILGLSKKLSCSAK